MSSKKSKPEDAKAAAAQSLEKAIPDATGPVEVTRESNSRGQTEYRVTASRLIPADPEDPALADVYVAVPVTGRLLLTAEGKAVEADLADVDPDAAREARAWVKSLIASGAVANVKSSAPRYGPPIRPTHEICEDSNGRRILRRIGFASS